MDRTQLGRGDKADHATVQLVIGVDFGTAFTKVVVGEGRIHYCVPFGRFATTGNPYLLPSAISSVGNGDDCMLGLEGVVADDLKTPLIDRRFGEMEQAQVVAFLALVYRYVRGWLFSTHGRTYMRREIKWFVNVGLPTDRYDDDELSDVYLLIARYAWTISVLPGPVSVNRALGDLTPSEEALRKLPSEFGARLLEADRITVFPEFAAQVAGYVRSPRHQDDMHAMIDVGGGTFDVTVFNVVLKEEGDVFPVLARRVELLGTRFLVHHRFRRLGLSGCPLPSPFENLPSDSEFARQYSISSQRLAPIDAEFQRKIHGVMKDVLNHTKRRRYPKSPRWSEGVPTFLCGGGALVEVYTRLLKSYEKSRPPFKLTYSDLPKPDDLDAELLNDGTYNRLAIAYGLSFDPFDIGEVIRMSEVEDIDDPPDFEPPSPFVSKDQV